MTAVPASERDRRRASQVPTDVGDQRARKVRASIHFTRATDRVDLAELGKIVRAANDGVLFLMLIPGAKGVLADVRALAAAKPDLLVRGVRSEERRVGKECR